MRRAEEPIRPKSSQLSGTSSDRREYMKNRERNLDWIISILFDIRNFSEKDGLTELAEQIDDTIFIAATEIASREKLSGRNGDV